MPAKSASPPDFESLDETLLEGVEGEDDLGQVTAEDMRSTVVASSDWTAETIVNQLDRGNIDVNPEFQRRDAWNAKRKSKFIESLILGLPIPQLVLAEQKTKKGSYLVIDGKQRLLSLRQFSSKPGDKVYEQLRLTGLEQREDLSGKTFQDFESDSKLQADLTAFQNQTIRTVVIKNWPNEKVLYMIFLRLNTSSVPLAPQELRQALHPGPFLSFVDEASGESSGLKSILNLTRPDFRMRDAELMVRYFAFRNYITDYKGNLKEFLDVSCKRLNKWWEAHEKDITQQGEDFEAALTTTYSIFGDKNAFRKWDGQEYERRFNRAVFDIMVYFFATARIRKAVAGKEKQLEAEFRKLCERNPQFVRSLETTTKSLDATATRLSAWGKTLANRLHIDFPIPKLEDQDIVLE